MLAAPSTPDATARRALMAVLADASAQDIAAGLQAIGARPAGRELRPTQTGLVMVRGRIGGDGAPFHVGEATVTRATVELATGEIGFAYVLGRDQEKARLAAQCDALWQGAAFRAAIEQQRQNKLDAQYKAALSKAGKTSTAPSDPWADVRSVKTPTGH